MDVYCSDDASLTPAQLPHHQDNAYGQRKLSPFQMFMKGRVGLLDCHDIVAKSVVTLAPLPPIHSVPWCQYLCVLFGAHLMMLWESSVPVCKHVY